MRNRLAAFLLIFGVLAATPALSDEDAAPWIADTDLAHRMWKLVATQGLLAAGDHVAEMEAALAHSREVIALAGSGSGDRFVLTDGPSETLMAMIMAGRDKSRSGNLVAIENPYWQIGLLLGSYYNEARKPDDALRVLDEGLASFVDAAAPAGAHMPDLEGERGSAFILLKRWSDGLAAYDIALGAPELAPPMKAHLLRGKGFVLTELGRLDDAESAYRESLTLDPGNPLAKQELDYIAGLKAGKAPAPTELKPAPAVDPNAPQSDKPDSGAKASGSI